MDSYGQDDEFRGGWVFCHIFEKYQGYFLKKKGVGGCFCQIRKLPGYFFKVEGPGWVVVKGMIFENPSYVP